MLRFLIKRAASSLFVLFVFVSLLFTLAYFLIPGDFATQFRLGMQPGEFQRLREGLGLTEPMWRQYLRFMTSLISFDLGVDYRGNPIAPRLMALLPWTLFVFAVGMGIAFPLGFWLGKLMAWRRNRGFRGGLRAIAVSFHTGFPPLLAFVLMVVFSRLFGLESLIDLRSFDRDASVSTTLWWMLAGVAIGAVTVWVVSARWSRRGRSLPGWLLAAIAVAIPLLLWWRQGIWSQAIDLTYGMSLLILAVVILTIGEVMLVAEGAMAGVRRENYLLTARAKGLSDSGVRDRHAARTALLAAVSKLLVSVPFFLTGLMIVETAFRTSRYIGLWLDVPGLSSTLFTSLEARDLPIVMSGLFLVGLITLGVRLILDVSVAYLDPRIRYAAAKGGSS